MKRVIVLIVTFLCVGSTFLLFEFVLTPKVAGYTYVFDYVSLDGEKIEKGEHNYGDTILESVKGQKVKFDRDGKTLYNIKGSKKTVGTYSQFGKKVFMKDGATEAEYEAKGKSLVAKEEKLDAEGKIVLRCENGNPMKFWRNILIAMEVFFGIIVLVCVGSSPIVRKGSRKSEELPSSLPEYDEDFATHSDVSDVGRLRYSPPAHTTSTTPSGSTSRSGRWFSGGGDL